MRIRAGSWSRFGLVVALLAMPGTAESQSPVTVHTAEYELLLTLWTPDQAPLATVVLVPGWGGGPDDVLGIGRALSADGITVAVLTPRGWHDREGVSTFAHGMEDIGAALEWVRTSDRADVDSESVILGGYSWGGGVSLAYAARDPLVSRVFSIAGTDHGVFIRQYQSDSTYAVMMEEVLASSAAPDGPIHFDVQHALEELADNQDVYGLLENADRLTDRSILLVGGWDDVNVTIEDTLLPLYRALGKAGANDVSFVAFQDDHAFRQVRKDLHESLSEWIR